MKLTRINSTTYEAALPGARIVVGDRSRPDAFVPCAELFAFEDEARLRVAYAERAYLLLSDDPEAAEVDRLTLAEGVVYPPYAVGRAYAVGDLIEYAGRLYEVVQAHTSQGDWPPDLVPALYRVSNPPGVITEWVQPLGAHDAYRLGAMVSYQGMVWRNTYDHNVWAPGVHGWGQTDGRADVDCYLLAPTEQHEGAFELEIVLRQRPASNVVRMAIETEGLAFYYQPELTAEETAEGCERPENVVGSYAVYHASCGQLHNGAAAAAKYGTGKAFHIYRPKVQDADGDWMWGVLHIDAQQGLLSITIDAAWLANAAYPVRVDPTFGYTTTGATGQSTTLSRPWGSWFEVPEDAHVKSLSVYVRCGTADKTMYMKPAIYEHLGLDVSSPRLAIGSDGSTIAYSASLAWHTEPLAYSINATTYPEVWLFMWANSADGASIVLQYDDYAGNGWRGNAGNSLTETRTFTAYNDRMYSLYATYSVDETYAADTLRRVTEAASRAADTLRRVTAAGTLAADTKRRVVTSDSRAADARRRVVAALTYTADAKRTLKADLTYRADTKRVVRALHTYLGDTLRRLLADNALQADTVRIVLADLLYAGDALRRTLRDDGYPGDTTRRVVVEAAYGGDALRRVATEVGMTADTLRVLRRDDGCSADTARRTLADLDWAGDTLRALRADLEYRADATRRVVADEGLRADTVRRVAAGDAYTGDALRRLLADLAYLADTRRAVVADHILQADARRRAVTDDATAADALRRVVTADSSSGDTLRRVVEASSYLADALRVLKADLSYLADTRRRTVVQYSYLADMLRELSSAVDIYIADTLRMLRLDASYTADALRRVLADHQYGADTWRGATTADAYLADVRRRAVAEDSLLADALRTLLRDDIYAGDALRRTLATHGYAGNALRRVVADLGSQVDTLRRLVCSESYVADTLRRIKGDMSYRADTIRRVLGDLAYLADTLRQLSPIVRWTQFILTETPPDFAMAELSAKFSLAELGAVFALTEAEISEYALTEMLLDFYLTEVNPYEP